MPNTEQFIPPSRLARLVSRIIYCGLLLPLEKLVGRGTVPSHPRCAAGSLFGCCVNRGITSSARRGDSDGCGVPLLLASADQAA